MSIFIALAFLASSISQWYWMHTLVNQACLAGLEDLGCTLKTDLYMFVAELPNGFVMLTFCKFSWFMFESWGLYALLSINCHYYETHSVNFLISYIFLFFKLGWSNLYTLLCVNNSGAPQTERSLTTWNLCQVLFLCKVICMDFTSFC